MVETMGYVIISGRELFSIPYTLYPIPYLLPLPTMIKQQLPNIVTSLNLLCGVLGILSLTFQYTPGLPIPPNSLAVYLMFAAAFFDFCDGFVARALKVDSPLGKQLDSLADVVTFGVLPGMLMFIGIGGLLATHGNPILYVMNEVSMHGSAYVSDIFITKPSETEIKVSLISAIPYLIPTLLVSILSAFRLAKFNIDTRQSHSFIGLPTPANGLFLASVYFAIEHGYVGSMHPAILSVLTLIFAILLVSPLPLFAMKFKGFAWKGNEVRFIFLGLLVVTITIAAILGKVMVAVPILVILYILISIINNITTRNTNEV